MNILYMVNFRLFGPQFDVSHLSRSTAAKPGVLPQLMETRVVMPGHKIWEATPEDPGDLNKKMGATF